MATDIQIPTQTYPGRTDSLSYVDELDDHLSWPVINLQIREILAWRQHPGPLDFSSLPLPLEKAIKS
jgi:hypothetical protein